MAKRIKLAYIGGGSKLWGKIFMGDLACAGELCGEVALYDIDLAAAERNKKIGGYIAKDVRAVGKFEYRVYSDIDKALEGADFVVISILPATFKEMRSDVHAPEKYGIFQPVGDTVGPGGVLRSMRTVPLYEGFARAIKKNCPDAWVINFTNPMTICTRTLYDVFPKIKAFGCCHEVFHAQEFLCRVLKEIKGVEAKRTELYTDACGINHFTWITSARYKGVDILSLLPEFTERFFDEGYYEYDRFAFRHDPFAYGNKVKMDTYRRYGALAAAGDRHLVEFMPKSWYLSDRESAKKWQFNFTSVDFRENDQREKVAEAELMAAGKKPFPVQKSAEEAVELIKAVLGLGDKISNVNMPNAGQMPQLPLGTVVETNCLFTGGEVKPVVAAPLPTAVLNLVERNRMNIETCYAGIKNRDLRQVFASFVNQPLCDGLSLDDAHALFKEMCLNTKEYLKDFFDLSAL